MITSTKNPHIIEACKLAERKHRRQQNRFLVEILSCDINSAGAK